MGTGKKEKIVREHMPYGHVLIVDDVEFSLSVAKGLMKPYGLSVETVTGGYDAIEKIKNGSVYDIIFMDYIMPEIDGIETTKLIREEGYTHPIVAMTANISPGQADTVLKNDFNDYIPKPINVRTLNDILNKWIRDKHKPGFSEGEHNNDSSASGDCISPDSACGTVGDNSIIEKLRGIDCINVDTALASVSGMTDVLADSVKLFARRLPDSVEKMDKLLSAGDAKELATITHGLKSVLKSIGASYLAGIATELEHAGNDEDISFYNKHYPSFRDSLLSLSEHLNAALQIKSSDEKKLGDKDLLLRELARVKTAAQDYDRDKALELIAPLLDFTYDESTDALLRKTVFALEEFDCEGALSAINQMLQFRP